MREAPSLISLCLEAVKNELFRGDDILSVVYDLPSYLFDILVLQLPPLPLQKLQMAMPFTDRDDHEYDDDGGGNGRKRGRFCNFDKAWKNLFELHWPYLVDDIQTVDWHQKYWEAHLQKCLDEAAEIALLPSFSGCLGEIKISETILKDIGYEGCIKFSTCDYSKLSYHCQEYGQYARCLRLQNVLCCPETCNLLRDSKFESLDLWWIRSEEHIGGLCKLLSQNSESLTSLKFIHCKLSSASVEKICSSLLTNIVPTHRIQNFSVTSTSFLETNLVSLPRGLVSLLSSGRSLCSLNFSCDYLCRNFAKMVFDTLCDASSGLSILDLSENNITGWLSDFNQTSSNNHPTSLGLGKSLRSLRVLNIRGNNLDKDDAVGLRYALVHMPNLEVLDISDNPIEDDGIRSLLPYFVEAFEACSPFAKLYVESCDLNASGVIELLNTLSSFKRPLESLSIADNFLGSKVAAVLGKFLSTSIQVLNISGIGLSSSGFEDLQQSITKEVKLIGINISRNRGGIATANFLSTLLPRAPELVFVNAEYNFMPVESSRIMCSALKAAKGNLELLDLTGNNLDSQTILGLAEIQRNGKLALIFSSLPAADAPYDDDP
ncbi:uncharacterized protein LOC21399004 isoform X1 [Morus notabilis]|uniref:uncharacterized protein LOC21399004 isoform X1 n=1 Tax=Morus notabilis TaxID=981085 RepID=UPI000CED6559|nr:uncharacterized protein LOC21399004 isoform X1 [Morus notabilis]